MASDPNTDKFIQDILTNYSTSYRTYKNTLIFSFQTQMNTIV
jgi:hypothetical protein